MKEKGLINFMTVNDVVKDMLWYQYVIIGDFGSQVCNIRADLMDRKVISVQTHTGVLVTITYVEIEK